MAFQGHRPTGATSWPLILVAGAPKTGKSYTVAELTGSDLIGETYWIEFGEPTAEEYGQVPGARYIIADHDGTFNDVLRRIREAIAEPTRDGKPNLIVVDCISLIWELLSAEMQDVANRRRKADVDAETKITNDLWNIAKARWKKLIRLLKSHSGPVVVIARLEVVAVMDAAGQPTKDKTQKVQAHKSLPYDVDIIVQIPEYRRYQITGVRSLVFSVPPGEKIDAPPDFTLDSLLRRMGLAELGIAEPRQFVEPVLSAQDAMAEFGSPQQDRPAQRSRGPVEGEWNSPKPPEATQQQLETIAGGLKAVRGVTEYDAQLAAVSQILEREIGRPDELTAEEADTVLAALRNEQKAKAKQQRQQSETAMAPDVKPKYASGAQLTALKDALAGQKGIAERTAILAWCAGKVERQLGALKDLYVDEADRLLGELTPAGAENVPLIERLTTAMRASVTSDELADVSERMWTEHEAGNLTQADVSKLQDISLKRESEIVTTGKAAA